MTWSRDEAVGLLTRWQSASTSLSLMFNSGGVMLKAVGQVAEISALALTLSWGNGEGMLTLAFVDVAAVEFPRLPEYSAAIVFRLASGASFGLFELLTEQDLSLDSIPYS